MENKSRAPYSYLFPLGILSATLAVLMWVGFDLKWIHFYPKQAHANLMFFSFFWSFIAGFLMTAIPKMTQTFTAQKAELATTVGFVILQWLANLNNLIYFSVLLFLMQLIVLLTFIIRRFLKKQQLPFEGFVFLPAAFVSALIGLICFFIKGEEAYSLLYLFSGQAFVLNLICGLGSRLIPVLTRIPMSLSPDQKGSVSKMKEMIILMLTLNTTFLIEAFYTEKLGYVLRFIVFLIIIIRYFKIFHKPSIRSFVGIGLRLSLYIMAFSYLALAVINGAVLPILHFVFISGFALVTLMVATRVTIAHGGESLDLELQSKTLVVIILAFILSGLFRFLTGWQLSGFLIDFAILFFLIGVLSWFVIFFKLLLRFS